MNDSLREAPKALGTLLSINMEKVLASCKVTKQKRFARWTQTLMAELVKIMRNASILTKGVSIQNFWKQEIQVTGPKDKNAETMATNKTYFFRGHRPPQTRRLVINNYLLSTT